MNTEEKIIQVPIEDIIPNRFQPRLAFDEEGLKELSESIKQHGVIQPLVLRRLGNKFEIIAGERRYKASTMAGLRTVPAIISNIDDNQSAEIALVENIQRRNLTAIEEAKSYKNLLDRGYMTQEQLAKKMGVSQSTIANKLRLLNLAPEVQDALLQNKIGERHARSLLALTKEEQAKWLQKIISKRWNVRELDLAIKKEKGGLVEEPIKESPTTNSDTMINNNNLGSVPTNDNTTIENIKREEPKMPNKFFNFLEDEAANMNMGINNSALKEEISPVEPVISNGVNNQIEVLGDFDDLDEAKESPLPKEEETFMPFNFGTLKNTESNNIIEEIKPATKDTIIDPMDSVIKLDPNYNQMLEEEKGLDLKTAINEIRGLVSKMEQAGFNLNLEEIDLQDSYQMTINIKKNDN